MNDVKSYPGSASHPSSSAPFLASQRSGESLADVLDRVLDKGLVVAGDIRINLLDIELLTIKIRLLVASVDKAREMGIDWWEHDPQLNSTARREQKDLESDQKNRRLRERVDELESRLHELLERGLPSPAGTGSRPRGRAGAGHGSSD